MKLFIIGLGSVIPEHVHVVEELAKQHEILYWLYIYDVAKSVDKARFPGTVFHDYRAALKGIHSENIDASRFEPWSKDDIVLFSAIESEIMSMIDKWYPDWPILKRKDFYYDLLCYWGGVLDQLNPDAILFADVPHQMFDFVLHVLSVKREMPLLPLAGASWWRWLLRFTFHLSLFTFNQRKR